MKYLSLEFKFQINLGSIFTFLFGICCGVVLLFLVYVLATLKKIDNENVIVNQDLKKITSDDIKSTVEKNIKDAQDKFLELRKENNAITWDTIKNVNLDLMIKVASQFYPESKHPLSELTIDELIGLDRYIMDKFEELLDKVGIKMIRKLKLSSVLKLLNVKQGFDNNKIVKTTKKYKLDKAVSIGHTIINVLNPGTWFKKLVYNPTITLITKKICLLLISIVGQEVYHIYSKQAFMQDYTDEEFDNLIRILNDGQAEERMIEDETIPDESDKDFDELSLLMNETIESKPLVNSKKKKFKLFKKKKEKV